MPLFICLLELTVQHYTPPHLGSYVLGVNTIHPSHWVTLAHTGPRLFNAPMHKVKYNRITKAWKFFQSCQTKHISWLSAYKVSPWLEIPRHKLLMKNWPVRWTQNGPLYSTTQAPLYQNNKMYQLSPADWFTSKFRASTVWATWRGWEILGYRRVMTGAYKLKPPALWLILFNSFNPSCAEYTSCLRPAVLQQITQIHVCIKTGWKLPTRGSNVVLTHSGSGWC